MKNLKVFVLMAGLTALLAALGQAFGGQGGLILALAFAGLMNFVMYFFSSTFVLRAYGAQVVTATQAPRLYAMVDRLRQRAGLHGGMLKLFSTHPPMTERVARLERLAGVA